MANLLESPKTTAILAALQWQGDRNDCGPFTTATVINALRGAHLDAIQLAEEMNKPAWRGPLFIVRRVPNWATFPWGMVDVFRQYGLPASWRPLAKPDDLREGLSRGDVFMPMIGEWKPLWAHVMTLVAWDDERGWGFANTQYNHHNIDWLDDKTFQTQWRHMGRLLVAIKNA
jgi:hypothetical protein